MTEWVDIVYEKAGDEKLAKLALEIIRRESGGWPNAKNPKSSASGLFQYLNSTWIKFCGPIEEKDDPIKQIDCALEMLRNGGIGHWSPSGPYNNYL